MKTLTTIALWLMALASCASETADDRRGDQPEEPAGEKVLVCVATFQNPSLAPEGQEAFERITATLDEAGIQSVAAGSRGFSLCVDSADAKRARELIAELLEREKLEAWLFER